MRSAMYRRHGLIAALAESTPRLATAASDVAEV
jgi:hypothetical protein